MCTLLTQNICLMCHTQELELYGNNIGDVGLTALARAVESGALAQCTYMRLGNNQIGDAGLTALASACASGALPALEKLNLAQNQIGDAGLQAFADVVSKGALASLKELIADDGPLGVDHPKLKAACQSRGIRLC